MKRAAHILFLLIVWLGFSSNLSMSNIFLGVLFSTLVNKLIVSTPLKLKVNLYHLTTLILLIFQQLIYSSLQVAWDIIRPKVKRSPEFLTLSVDLTNCTQVSLLANLISLTPGTLAVDILEDTNEIVLHLMFSQNKQNIVNFIKDRLEPKINKAFYANI